MSFDTSGAENAMYARSATDTIGTVIRSIITVNFNFVIKYSHSSHKNKHSSKKNLNKVLFLFCCRQITLINKTYAA
jgi:hypothetical protein